MALIQKNSANYWDDPLGWIGGVQPTSFDVAFLGPQTTLTGVGVGAGTLSASCVSMNGDSGNTSFSVGTTGGILVWGLVTSLFRRNTTQGGNSQYSLYVGQNRTLQVSGRLNFDPQYESNHYIYVESGGLLRIARNPSTSNANVGGWIANDTTTAGVRIFKQGPGEVEFGNNMYTTNGSVSTPLSTRLRGGFTLQDGKLRLGGYNPPNEALGVSGSGFNNTLEFNKTSGGNPILHVGFLGLTNETLARPVSVPVSMITDGTILAGSTVSGGANFQLTMTGAATGSGVLTIAREAGGQVIWNNTVACPLNVTGLLTMGSGHNITSSTLTGTGTVALTSNNPPTNTINGTNAPSYTGSFTGLFNYRAATRATALTMRGNIAGTVRIPVGTITFTNPTNSGYLEIIEDADVTLQNSFFNGSGSDGLTGSWVYMKNPRPILRLVGPGAGCAQGRWYAPRSNSHIYLTQGATLSTDRYYADQLEFGVSDNYVISGDTSTNTFNAPVIMAQGTPSAPARVNFICRTDGTFVVAGTLYASTPAASSGDANFTFNVYTPKPNGTPEPDADYQGTIRWTGTCAGSISNLSVGRGTLQIVRTTQTNLANGLTIQSGATLHCATPNAAYAAQLSGNLTLSAGSIMKFGAAA